MKKLLALVLALVMSMSLVTISNAAFKDADKIDYSEAVDVMNAVGVLAGYDNGDFGPQDTLTRAQACKIIAYLDLGGKTADAINGSGVVFSDVPATAWYAGYVEYCAGAGYVSGVGGGKFDPEAKVTGIQFAKMLLCALGYDAEVEGYTGADYTIAIARDANKVDLFDGLSIVTSAALTREQAAQMALNALKADTVEYSGGTSVSTSDGTTVKVNAERKNIETSKNYNNDAGDLLKREQLTEKLYGNDLKLKDDGTDDFGRPANIWTYKTEEIGKYSQTADYTYTGKVTRKALYNDLGKTVYDDMVKTNDGVEGYAADLTVCVDGIYTVGDDADFTKYLDKNSTAKIGASKFTGNGTLTEVFVNSDTNAVTIVIINTYVVQASGDYNTKKEEVKVDFPDGATTTVLNSGEKTLSSEDFAVEDVKEDDYLLITVGNKVIKTVTPAETVSGKVGSFSVGNDVTLDGTTYKYTNNIKADATHGKNVSFAIGDEATVVLDAYGYIIYVDEAKASSDNYVYITKFADDGVLDTTLVAKAYFLDGTCKEITVKNDDDYSGTSDAGWYAYTEKKDGKYELANVANADLKRAAAEVGNKLTVNGQTYIVNDDVKVNKSTLFVVVDDDEIKVYEGINAVPTITANNESGALTAYAKMDGSFAEYVFIDATDATFKKTNKSETEYVYLLDLDKTGTDADENVYYQYNAIIDGEKTTIKLDDSTSHGSMDCNALYEDVEYDSETGYVSSMDKVVAGSDYKVGSFSGDEITYSKGVVSFLTNALTDDCNIYLVVKKGVDGINDNDNDYTVNTVSGSGLETECKDYNVDCSYVAVLDDDGFVTDLYVYITAATPVV